MEKGRITGGTWVNEPEKFPAIYRMLIEEARRPKQRMPLAAITKLLWHCWQTEDWFPHPTTDTK
jgi:Protein of unknown function (DUF4050)